MADFKLETEILGILYKKWWHDTVIGYTEKKICEKAKADDNRVSQALQILESQYYIDRGNHMWYKITSPSGIEAYEEVLLPSSLAKKETQRKMIMKILEEVYDKDTSEFLQNDKLSKATGIEDVDEIYAQMRYLESKGYVHLIYSMGKQFHAKLLADGKLALSSYEPQNYQSTVNAYRSLFVVENYLRKFIETKLTERYGADWWEKGISSGLRDKADERKSDEQQYGWQVSDTERNLEYLSFPDLSKIIANQWSVFRPVFEKQSKIELRLNELEVIRNAIAHTRTLTEDAMNRLEQYSDDIFNLTK